MKLFLTCLPGLEPVLAEEIREKKMGTPKEVPGGVEMDGGLRSIYRANLELGTAQQVRARIGMFRVANVGEVAKKVSKVELERWIDPARELQIGATSRGASRASRLHHTDALIEAVERGIHRRLKTTPSRGQAGGRLRARLIGDNLTISVDTSGAPLHRRGYRLASGKAPLREDVAHALVRVSGWDRTSSFVDPLVGAGTLAIEAGLLARGLPPGLHRTFDFELVPCFDAPLWERTKTAATSTLLESPMIFGSDRNAGGIEAARANAERAGVEIELQVASLSAARDWNALEQRGALVTNPPWGGRLAGDMKPLYRRLGDVIRGLPGGWAVGLIGPPELGRGSGAPLRSALMTDVGGTKVHFFVREGG